MTWPGSTESWHPTKGMRVKVSLLVVLIACLAAVAGAQASSPTLTITPTSGPQGTTVTIGGAGFEPGDTVSVELVPGTRFGNGGPHYRIAEVAAAPDGTFEFQLDVWNIYSALTNEPAIPGGGLQVEHVQTGPWMVFAYPHSFGDRTQDALARAPRAVFDVTAGSLPAGGGQASAPGTFPPAGAGVGALLVLLGAAAIGFSLRYSSSRQ